MMEPIPAPAIQGQPDPFRDDPVSTSRVMPRYRGSYSSPPARMAAGPGAQQASYAAPVVSPQMDRYRPAHATQLRRANVYSSPSVYR
jgi:hypothetical protein